MKGRVVFLSRREAEGQGDLSLGPGLSKKLKGRYQTLALEVIEP